MIRYLCSAALAAAFCVSGGPAAAAPVVASIASPAVALAEAVDLTWAASGTINVLGAGQFSADAVAQFEPFGEADFTVFGQAGATVDGVTSVSGDFTFDFGDDSFMGMFTGENFPRDPVTQVALFTRSLTILGGTGIFDGASGSMTGTGSNLLTPGATPPITFNLVGEGTITATGPVGVPEPATMLLLAAGLAGVGAVMGKRAKHER